MRWDGTARTQLLPSQLQCDAPRVPGEPVRQLAAGLGGAVQKRRGTPFPGFHLGRALEPGPPAGQERLSSRSKPHGTLISFSGAWSSSLASRAGAGSPRVPRASSPGPLAPTLAVAPSASAAPRGGPHRPGSASAPRPSSHFGHPAPRACFSGGREREREIKLERASSARAPG